MRPFPVAWTLAALALNACAVDANYTLQLVPRVPNNQDPFADGPAVRVRLMDPAGNADWTTLGTLASGTIEDTGFPALDGHTVGVALGGNTRNDVDLAAIFAYGESPPQTLADEGLEVTVDVLIAQLDGVGALGELDKPGFGVAVAATGEGAVYLFGGAPVLGGSCATTIWKLEDLNGGDWEFDTLGAKLPEGVCQARATVVELDGREQIVVSGGEKQFNGYSQRSSQVVIFDPSEDEVAWSGSGTLTRARHTVVELADGRLFLLGANQNGAGAPNFATWEIFDPSGPSFDGFGDTEMPPWDFMAAPASGGVAVCGGGKWSGPTITPTTGCAIVGSDGSSSALDDLPQPLRAGAMARLADGRLLVAGGIATEGEAGRNLPAIDGAWILDPGASNPRWKEVDAMGEARAYFQLVPDGIGGAIALGGAASGWAFGVQPEGTPQCGERFVVDGDGGRWEPLDPCPLAGAGMNIAVGVHPGPGVLMIQGQMDADSGGGGGTQLGIVSLGPS